MRGPRRIAVADTLRRRRAGPATTIQVRQRRSGEVAARV